ncbi:DeoR/GlpR family DNA-binding transcription regulator [Pseudonocardia sp. NPDC049635]|uniref:DeoR/GlpR family DNA-binding transcription regulator n=1 Tax=Pseudonocardia sp. NPDC049635 TaxID=3155506 RepID=UPI0033C38274
MSLLAEQRREMIVERVRTRGAVRVSELAEHLGVSEMTVRRDLDVLARHRLLDKVHGGATVVGDHTTTEPGFAAKAVRELAEKEAIAVEAAALVEPGAAVGLSAGTTTWRLAHRLARIPRLTVVTNSPAVAEALHAGGAEARGTTVILTGGVRTPSEALVGPIAIAALRSLNLEIVFLGVHGMSAAAGFSTPNLTERDTDRALVDAGRRLVVVADHTKWGTVGISTIAELNEADVLVTDSGLADADRAVLDGEIDRVIVARPEQP